MNTAVIRVINHSEFVVCVMLCKPTERFRFPYPTFYGGRNVFEDDIPELSHNYHVFSWFLLTIEINQCGELLGKYGIRLGLLRAKRHRYHRYGKTSSTWDIFEVCPYTGWYCPGRVCHISAFKTQHGGNTPNRQNAKNNIPPETLQTWGLLYYSLSLYRIYIYIYICFSLPK